VRESYSRTKIGIFIAPKFLTCRDATFSAYTKLGGRVSEKFSLSKEGRTPGGGSIYWLPFLVGPLLYTRYFIGPTVVRIKPVGPDSPHPYTPLYTSPHPIFRTHYFWGILYLASALSSFP
jgi:hypothetical protein